MQFVIDGHNLLKSVQYEDEQFELISDLQLCHIIGRYLKKIRQEAQIVFDGTGPKEKQGFENIINLEVIFAGPDKEADDIIENKINASSAARNLTVVTGDKKILTTARRRKADTIKPKLFWEHIRKQLSRPEKLREPLAKRYGISENETEYWMKIFRIED